MQRTSLTADFRTARLDLTLYIWPRASPLCLRPRSSSCNTPRNWPAACRTCRSAARCRTSSPRRWAERWWWRRRPWTRPRRGPELRSRTAPGKLSAVRQREVRLHNNSYIVTHFNQSRFTLPTMQLCHRVTSLEAIWSVQLEVSISDFHCSEKHGRSLRTGSLQQLIQQSRELKKRHEAPDANSQRLLGVFSVSEFSFQDKTCWLTHQLTLPSDYIQHVSLPGLKTCPEMCVDILE